jgi:glycosyltransferase involved in cell wall biosynthesis
MEILQVASSLQDWAGIEKYVASLQQGLILRGHDVSVSVTPATPLAKVLPLGKIEIPLRGKWDLRAFAAYLRLFRTKKFEIVNVHFNPDFLVAAYAARFSTKPSLVLTRHVSLPWSKIKAKTYSRLYDRIIPVSHSVERRLEASGVPREKMRVAKAGCAAMVRTHGALLANDGTFRVGFFGRLTEEKGIRVLLEAASMLSSGSSVHFFGEGPLDREIAQASSLDSKISLHGFQSDVAAWMSSVDVVVIPSIWEEAFPFSALESMSMGLPVVASDIGGLPEIFATEQTGLLVEPGNATALAAALERVKADRNLGRNLGERAERAFQEQYTTERMAERIESVYRELVDERRP